MAEPTDAGDRFALFNWFARFVKNPWLTIGSFIAALVIWFYISSKVEDKIHVPAKLNLETPPGYVVTEIRDYQDALVSDRIELPLHGPVSELERIKRNKTLIIQNTIPVSNMEEDVRTIPVKITEKNLSLRTGRIPIGIHMDPLSITLRVTVEKVVTESRPVITPNLSDNISLFTRGKPASNYQISEISSEISSVEVRGPVTTLENARLIPDQPIDVTGRASREARRVNLKLDPPSPHTTISPDSVTISVHIVSQMIDVKMQVPFQISTGPTLSEYLNARGWAFNPENRMLAITLKLPKSIDRESFGPAQVHPILILPKEEIQVLKDPTRPHGVPTEEFIHVFISRSVQNRDKISVQKIEPKTIKFVPSE